MSHPSSRRDRGRSAAGHAAVFIDYENLFRHLGTRLPAREHPHAYVTEMLDALRRRLREAYRAPAVMLDAFADFGALQGDGSTLQRMLVEQDVAPRPTSATLGANASELALALAAADVARTRPDVTLFVVVAGDRAYLPLVQHLKRLGKEALVVTLESPVRNDALPYLADNFFLDTHALFGDGARRALFGGNGGAERPSPEPAERRPHADVTDDDAVRTLEVIEEHFGQYDEVYLTPLLRKLSETFDDPDYDPKTVVSSLEEAGAVWLEKRRGFPYDYTVLLVDDTHPDVLRVQEAYDAREGDDYNDYDDDYAEHDEWAEPA